MIKLESLPARMRALADEMELVGAAVRYYGGFGPFGEYGGVLEAESSAACRNVAEALEALLVARGGEA